MLSSARICTLSRVPATLSLRTDKQRMLRQRIEQILAEAEVAKQQLASYRAYQQRELEEVRPFCRYLACNPSLHSREKSIAEPTCR
eukprot:COSAG04_NODE_173_length_21572_cov_104.574256_12_plen_86_part_00